MRLTPELKAALQKLADGSLKPMGKTEKTESITIVAQTHQKGITGFRIEALADKDLPKSAGGSGVLLPS